MKSANQIMKTDRSTLLTLAILAAVVIVTLLVYWPGLSGPPLLDDIPQLEGLIKESGIDPEALFRNYIISTSGPSGRPVAMATFIANAIAHGPDNWWWKYSNLMFHLINGLLVLWFTAMLFQGSPGKSVINPWKAGIIVAGLWLLHPLHVSTVLYTVQRMTQLSTLFVLAGLICYAKGRLIQERSGTLGWLLIGLGFLVFYPLGILSKENAFIFPVFCSLVELLVLRFRAPSPSTRQLKIFHGVLLAGYLGAGLLLIANFSSIVLETYATRDFTLSERLLTQFRVIATYLSMLLLPIQRNMGFFHDDLVVSTSLFEPFTTILSALLLVALVISAIALRRKMPLYAFGILFFFTSHVIESSFIGLEMMFEHRNYLGSIGILIAVMSVCLLATGYRRALTIIAAISLVGFSLLTWQRSITWSSPSYMYQYMYRAHPESSRLNIIHANVSAIAKDFPSAHIFLDKARQGLGVELHRLYLYCLEHRSVGREALSRVVQIQDGVLDAHTILSADALVEEIVGGRCDAPKEYVVEVLDHVLDSRSRSAVYVIPVLFAKAKLLESMGDIEAAVVQYFAAQELSSTDALPLFLAAATLIRAGQLDSARSMLARAQEFEKEIRMQRTPLSEQIYLGLGAAYENARRPEDALAVYAEATESMPKRSVFYLKSARLLLELQRYEEAEVMLNDIRNGDLVDLDEYQYAMERIATELSRRSQ